MSGLQNTLKTHQGGQAVKLLVILGLVLLLQIPVELVDRLIHERSQSRFQATEDVTQKWGGQQTLIGPHLLVPVTEQLRNGVIVERTLSVMPESLLVDATLSSEVRSRGIYDIPLYRAAVNISGDFDVSKLHPLARKHTVNWERAKLVLGVTDPKAITSASPLIWNGNELQLQPGADAAVAKTGGLHVAVKVDPNEPRYHFSAGLSLGGHDRFSVAPLGSNSLVRLKSDWPDPSFQGAWLPKQHQVTKDGFSAEWEIPYLSRNFPASWFVGEGAIEDGLHGSTVGVKFLNSLDSYGRVERSTKYDLIFIGLTFLCFWLLEVLGAVRIHPVQYLLVGSAISLFYLLLLSIAEHAGFAPAYLIATVMVVGLVFVYTKRLLGQRRGGAMIASGLAALYAYLYALLHEQAYALLAGSIGLFVILGLVMYLTRGVDWYRRDSAAME